MKNLYIDFYYKPHLKDLRSFKYLNGHALNKILGGMNYA